MGTRYEARYGAHAMKRPAAGAHLRMFLSLRNAQTIEPTTAWTAVEALGTRFYFEWSGALSMGEQWWGLTPGPMSIPSELAYLAMPINFLTQGKNQIAQASFQPGTTRSRSTRHTGSASVELLKFIIDEIKIRS